MTDVVARRSSLDLDEVAIEQAQVAAPRRNFDVSLAGRAALAAFLVGAAVIHFVMAPSHLGEWTAEGVAFLVAGWAQVLLAIAIARRATRTTLWIAIALNLAFVA